MEQLKDAIVQTFNKKVEDGTLQKQIEAHMDKFMNSVFSDVMASYGDVSKALKEKIQKELIGSIDRFSLQNYNGLVVEKIKERLEKHYVGDALTHLKKVMDDLFDVPEVKTFAELVELFQKDHEEEARDEQWEKFTCEVDDRDHIVFISLDRKPDQESYKCEYRLTMDRAGQILSVQKREDRYSSGNHGKMMKLGASTERWDKFDKMLFQLSTMDHPLEKNFSSVSESYDWYDG